MSSSLSCLMLRSSAPKGVAALNLTRTLTSRTMFLNTNSVHSLSLSRVLKSKDFHTTTATLQRIDDPHNKDRRSRPEQPQPVPAPAFFQDDVSGNAGEDAEDGLCRSYMTSPTDVILHPPSATRGFQSSIPPTFSSRPVSPSPPSKRKSSGIGGGGGNGTSGGGSGERRRCTNCGAQVVFIHEDFEEDCYYCASCAGWIRNAPSSAAGGRPTKDPDIIIQPQRVSTVVPFDRVIDLALWGDRNNVWLFSCDLNWSSDTLWLSSLRTHIYRSPNNSKRLLTITMRTPSHRRDPWKMMVVKVPRADLGPTNPRNLRCIFLETLRNIWISM